MKPRAALPSPRSLREMFVALQLSPASCGRCSYIYDKPKQIAGDGSTFGDRPKQIAGDVCPSSNRGHKKAAPASHCWRGAPLME